MLYFFFFMVICISTYGQKEPRRIIIKSYGLKNYDQHIVRLVKTTYLTCLLNQLLIDSCKSQAFGLWIWARPIGSFWTICSSTIWYWTIYNLKEFSKLNRLSFRTIFERHTTASGSLANMPQEKCAIKKYGPRAYLTQKNQIINPRLTKQFFVTRLTKGIVATPTQIFATEPPMNLVWYQQIGIDLLYP